MIFGKIPEDYITQILEKRAQILTELDSVYAKMAELVEAVRAKEEEESFMVWTDWLSLRTPFLTERAQEVRRKRDTVTRCVQVLTEESDGKNRIAAAARLSLQIAGILRNILWTIEMSDPEWMVIGVAAHRFQEYGEGLARFEFSPELWGEGEYVSLDRVKNLPKFEEKDLEDERQYHSKDPEMKKALLRCLVKAVNSAYRFSQGPVDPWAAYIILLDIQRNRPPTHNSIEKEVATKAFEEFMHQSAA